MFNMLLYLLFQFVLYWSLNKSNWNLKHFGQLKLEGWLFSSCFEFFVKLYQHTGTIFLSFNLNIKFNLRPQTRPFIECMYIFHRIWYPSEAINWQYVISEMKEKIQFHSWCGRKGIHKLLGSKLLVSFTYSLKD